MNTPVSRKLEVQAARKDELIKVRKRIVQLEKIVAELHNRPALADDGPNYIPALVDLEVEGTQYMTLLEQVNSQYRGLLQKYAVDFPLSFVDEK